MRIRIIAISAAAAFLVAGLSACAKKPSDGSSVSKGSASAVESQLFPSVGTESEYRITESEANELFTKQGTAASTDSSSNDDNSKAYVYSNSQGGSSSKTASSKATSSSVSSSEKGEWTKGWN